jgi:hypothetical protein
VTGRSPEPMLGHGRHHEKVPRDLAPNLRFRASLWDECLASATARRLVTRACEEDILFWINVFGWQTNPDNFDAEDGPFITFPFQEDALLGTIRWQILERRPVIWEKSRKQGGTFLALFKSIWLALFHHRKRSLWMSHMKEAVEKSGDEDTLFGKIQFILSHLPSWMTEGIEKLGGIFAFSRTKSQVAGTSTTVRSGVGGRVTEMNLDEFSKYNNPEAILGQTRDTGPPLLIGTHYGVGGLWYDLCKDPLAKKFVFHWSKSPMYNRGLYRSDPKLKPHERGVLLDSPPPDGYPFVTDGSPHGGPFPGLRSPYYDELCRTRSKREIAMHWDIDPAGASHQFFDPELVRDLVLKYAREPDFRGDVSYDPDGTFHSLRRDPSGPLKLWLTLLPGCESTGRYVVPSEYKLGADVGAGTGATPTCFSVGDAVTGKKVAEWASARLTPENAVPVAIALCHLFSSPGGLPAKLIFDATGQAGAGFKKALKESSFRHVWLYKGDELGLNTQTTDQMGWYSNGANKYLLLSKYESALRQGHLVNPSEEAVKECLAFEKTATTIEHGTSLRSENPDAGRVNHSDLTIADALMWKLMEEAGAARSPKDRAEAAGGDYPPDSLGDLLAWAEAGQRKSPFRR